MWNFISNINKYTMVSSWERLLKILLNSTSVGGLSFFLMQPYGNGFVIAIPYWLLSSILTLFRMGFFGTAHRWGGGAAFWAPLPKIRHTYRTMMKLGTVIPYLRNIQKMYKSLTHSLSSAGISIFLPEIRKFCYIKKYTYRLEFDT